MEEIYKRESVKKKPNKYTSADLLQHSKLPPQAIELEEAVLGAMMLEKNALTNVIDILKPETFYKDSHKIIFEAIRNLFTKSQPVDILTVTQELKQIGKLDLAGGAYLISQLASRVASSANIEFHSRIIIQKYIQRELIRISAEINTDAYNDTTDVLELLDRAEKNLFSIGEDNLRRKWSDMKTLINEAVKAIDLGKSAGQVRGIPSGFTKLDHITNGWQKSDLIIVAARPSMGKTAFTLSMARNMAVSFNKPVAFFSLEMSALQLVTRLIASETELNFRKLNEGNLSKEEWDHLQGKIHHLTEAPIFIDDTPALSIFELRAKCRRLKQQHDIQAVIVDYLQLMSSGGETNGNRVQEISNISRSLKSLAKELDIPVIVLSQLSRAVETRTSNQKKPILSDLRESGAIEQDADIVVFLYRPEYYQLSLEDGSSSEGVCEVIISKHRNGAVGSVNMKFIKEFAKFEDLEEYNHNHEYTLNRNVSFDSGEKSFIVQSKMNTDSEPF